MILTIKTDNPVAEIGLYIGQTQVDYYTWHADRQLTHDILTVIHTQLQAHNTDWHDITGVVVYQGPGSFTGLRIGITVANSIAYARDVPVVAQQGADWILTGVKRLMAGQTDTIALPHYGAEANITLPKK